MCEKSVASSFEFELNFFGFHSQQNETIGFQPDRLAGRPGRRRGQRPSGSRVSGPNGTTMRMSFRPVWWNTLLVTASFAYCDGVVCSTLTRVGHGRADVGVKN